MDSKLSLRSTMMLKGIFHLINGLPDSAIKCHPVTTSCNNRA